MAKKAKSATTKKPAKAPAKKLSALDAATKVLGQKKKPMSAKELIYLFLLPFSPLKKPKRMASLLFILVWALMIMALMERAVRRESVGEADVRPLSREPTQPGTDGQDNVRVL